MTKSKATTDEIDKAVVELNDSLRLMHKLSGSYPTAFIRTQVEAWYSESQNDKTYVLNIISWISNSKYRGTALTHLSKLTGINKSDLEFEITNLDTSGVEPLSNYEKKEAFFLFCFALVVILGVFALIGHFGSWTLVQIMASYLGILFVGGIVVTLIKGSKR